MKNKLILGATTIWAVLAALNEAGVLDVIPLSGEAARWFKWFVAVLVVYVNYRAKPVSIAGGGDDDDPVDPNPPGTGGGVG